MGVSLISNPPYNMKWRHPALAGLIPQYTGWELPPESNANYAFILSGLAYVEDRGVFLLPNGALSSGVSAERSLREQLIRKNLLLAIIALPGRMFESTSIPTCLLVFDRRKRTRRIALMDLTERCTDEVRDQRGQFGGSSHTGRTYHKTVKAIPQELMRRCLEILDSGKDEAGLCVWVDPEQVEAQGWDLSPRQYFELECDQSHRPFPDIAADYNRVIRQKNAIKIRMNRTAAKRLGYDCMERSRPDLTESFAVAGQVPEKENYISFGADDGITIKISTKEGVHPLVIEFLSHWKQMVMYLNNEENRILAEFRDALLHELMNGKIEIGDKTEQPVEMR